MVIYQISPLYIIHTSLQLNVYTGTIINFIIIINLDLTMLAETKRKFCVLPTNCVYFAWLLPANLSPLNDWIQILQMSERKKVPWHQQLLSKLSCYSEHWSSTYMLLERQIVTLNSNSNTYCIQITSRTMPKL